MSITHKMLIFAFSSVVYINSLYSAFGPAILSMGAALLPSLIAGTLGYIIRDREGACGYESEPYDNAFIPPPHITHSYRQLTKYTDEVKTVKLKLMAQRIFHSSMIVSLGAASYIGTKAYLVPEARVAIALYAIYSYALGRKINSPEGTEDGNVRLYDRVQRFPEIGIAYMVLARSPQIAATCGLLGLATAVSAPFTMLGVSE